MKQSISDLREDVKKIRTRLGMHDKLLRALGVAALFILVRRRA